MGKRDNGVVVVGGGDIRQKVPPRLQRGVAHPLCTALTPAERAGEEPPPFSFPLLIREGV